MPEPTPPSLPTSRHGEGDTVQRARPVRHALAVELTPYCNQTCTYCYNDWRGDKGEARALPTGVLLETLGRALDEVDFDHVTLTGGEPFARADIFQVLELVANKGSRALIISNGGLITEAIATRLAPFRPYFVQITLNGPTSDLHNEHVDGNHFDATLAGIAELRRAGVAVGGSIVVTRKNAHVVGATLELFGSLGVTQFALSRYSPAGYAATHTADLLPSRSDFLEALKQAKAYAVAKNAGEAAVPQVQVGGPVRIQVTMPVPACVIDTKEFPEITFSACPIGTEAQEFALGSDGKLRNCTLYAEPIGDGRTESFADLVESPKVSHYRDVTPEFCAPCPMKARCLGGCGAASVSVYEEGSPFRGLDPFVAQHVDDAFAKQLQDARSGGTYVPLGRTQRRAQTDHKHLPLVGRPTPAAEPR